MKKSSRKTLTHSVLASLFIGASLITSCTTDTEELDNLSTSNSNELNSSTVQAEDYDNQSGIRIAGGGSRVGFINNGDWIRFDDFDYDGAQSISISAGSNASGGTIEIRTGSPTGGDLLGTVAITNTGGWGNFETFTGSIDDDSSNSDLYLVFRGGSGSLFDVNSFSFSGSSSGNGGNSGSDTNLALSGNAEQSSTSFGGSAARAIDGNTSGIWNQRSVTHTSSTSQPWWQVRLDNNTNIEEIVIWNRTNCCSDRLSNFDVFVYNTSGTQVYKTTITDTPDPSVTINTGGVNGNRVRVKLKDTNFLSLAEVQVFGDSGNGGTSTPTNPTNPEPTNPEPTNPEPTNPGNPSSNFPGEAIGLTLDNWKLNGFDGEPDDDPDYEDDLLDALNLDYSSYQNDDWFYEEDGFAWFKCYRGLGGSSNSSNPRVELRELFNGNDDYVWDGDNGTHIMEWTVRVDQLPQDADGNGGVLCFGQIHGPSDSQGFNDDGVDVDDTIRVQFIGEENQSSGNVKLKISGYITEEQGGSVTLDTNYRLDTEYDFRITMSRGFITVDIDNREVFGRQLDTSGDKSYFKVGNYLQSVKNASFNGSFGLVGIKNLSVTHPNSSENK